MLTCVLAYAVIYSPKEVIWWVAYMCFLCFSLAWVPVLFSGSVASVWASFPWFSSLISCLPRQVLLFPACIPASLLHIIPSVTGNMCTTDWRSPCSVQRCWRSRWLCGLQEIYQQMRFGCCWAEFWWRSACISWFSKRGFGWNRIYETAFWLVRLGVC